MSLPAPSSPDALFDRVAHIVETARGQVARSVNTAMVHAYWHIGREIVEYEQGGEARAEYGARLLHLLSERLETRYGKGFGVTTLERARLFYLTWPQGSRLVQVSLSSDEENPAPPVPDSRGAASRALFPSSLGWSHYLRLVRVKNPEARAFYEIEAAQEGWSARELERQISTLLYERLARSRDKEAVRSLARHGHQIATPSDVLKEPLVLEFLGLEERSEWRERELEQAIIDRLEHFLLELGKGFCFVGRQRRITLAGDHFYVDLVFYNRLLRCFVLVELKLGKLTHQDIGQMLMYVNWFDQFQRQEWEQPTVGIILCSEKNDAMVKITLGEGNDQVFATAYQLYLPTAEELRQEVVAERDRIEHARRLLSGGEE